MIAALPAFGADGFYPYASNDGIDMRERDYPDRWTRRPRPWLREPVEPSRRAAESSNGYVEAPYGAASGADRSRYGARANGWAPSHERTQSPPDHERFADPKRDSRLGRQPDFQGESDDYGYGSAPPPTYPRVDDWRDEGAWQRPQWSTEDDWAQHGDPRTPFADDRREPSNQEVSKGIQDERPGDPRDASYTPNWGAESSSSYYDPEPFDPWVSPEVEQNGWHQEAEERPWGRPRPPPEDGSPARGENRRWEGGTPPDAAYRYGAGFGPYGESWYYPGFYGAYPPPFGAPGAGGLSGLAAWERMLWGGGVPGPLWWY